MPETLTRFENEAQIDFHAASEHLISAAQLEVRKTIEQQAVPAYPVAPEILHVTEAELILQAGKNVYAIRHNLLDSTITADDGVNSANQFDLAA